jgi:hypothetical protein
LNRRRLNGFEAEWKPQLAGLSNVSISAASARRH